MTHRRISSIYWTLLCHISMLWASSGLPYTFESCKFQVLVFLDSHIEVNCDWLQPLLARIAESRSTVAVPIIDIINSDTFEYSASPLVRGGFNWGLHFKWENLPTGTLAVEEDFVKPIRSPNNLQSLKGYHCCETCWMSLLSLCT